jgi:hypothetical protein
MRRERLHHALDYVLDEAEFKESEHPRADNGQFGSGGSAAARVRGHIDEDDYTAVTTKRTSEQKTALIKQELGCSKSAAKTYERTAASYCGQGYTAIRSGEDPQAAKVLEDFIEKSPKWDGNGPLHRGIGLTPQEAASLVPGAVVDMKGLSSWSSDPETAKGYAARAQSGQKRVLLELDKADTGTSIGHLSEYASEREVLLSGKTKYEVVSSKPVRFKDLYGKIRVGQSVKVREVPA